MTTAELIALVTQTAFPAAVAWFVLYRLEKVLGETRDAVRDLANRIDLARLVARYEREVAKEDEKST